MQCNAVMGAVLILLLLVVLEGTSGRPQRAKRRAPPRLDKPLSLEDLKFECCSQVWRGCCAEGAALLNSNSTTNNDHDLCVQEAREQLYQDAASPVVASVAHSVEKGANCSVSSKQRKAARKKYCDYLQGLDFFWTHSLLNEMRHLAASGCVQFYNSTHHQYRSPHQIFEGIVLWHKKWTDRYRSKNQCCHPFSTLRSSLPSPITARCSTAVWSKTSRWDTLLTRVARMMHMLELLRNTGRRRTCLRGCVSEREVECSNLM